MSNPGVIKLIRKKVGTHELWLDDNIGESIHIHYDQFRIDLSIEEFLILCQELKKAIIELAPFDISDIDDRTLGLFGRIIYDIEDITLSEKRLSELRVYDDGGVCPLPLCNRVRSLNGEVDINTTKARVTNYYNQTNSDRLNQCLEHVKKYGYPSKGSYIWVHAGYNTILDGWHRAACLYHLYGDIEVPVKMINFKKNTTNMIFPLERIPKGSKVILYGAGKHGKKLIDRLKEENYKLVAWCDKAADEIKEIKGEPVLAPFVISQRDYDYVIVSVENRNVVNEIIVDLIKQGVNYDSIVTFWSEL